MTSTLKNAQKLMTRSELKSFSPIIKGQMKELKAAELKKKIALSKKAVRKYQTQAKKKKTLKKNNVAAAKSVGIFRSLRIRLENQLNRIQAKVTRTSKGFGQPQPEESVSILLENQQKRRKAASKKAPIAAKHWEKTPLRRMAGFQSARSRYNQGQKDHRSEIKSDAK